MWYNVCVIARQGFFVRIYTQMNQPIKDLIERYKDYLHALEPHDDVPKIHVDEIAAKFAEFYEKIRGFIDYKEEHLLRKNFIDRVFRRRFFLKDFTGNIGEGMIKEIIRSGRLPNDAVPETKIQEVDRIVNGLMQILADLKKFKIKKEEETTEWLIDMTVNSIEEALFPPLKESMISETMFWSLKEKFSISGAKLSEDDINMQLFIGIQRALLRVDEDQLNYRLLKFIYPNWNSLSADDRALFVVKLPETKDKIASYLKHPVAKYFFKLVNKYNTIFYLIGDIIDKRDPADEFKTIFEDEEKLKEKINEVYDKRYEKERSRLNKLAFLSVLSIFLSKIFVALGAEIPLDLYFFPDDFSVKNIIINILFPPFLMLVTVLLIKMPSEENEELVWEVTKNICYGDEKKGYGIIVPKKQKLFTRFIIQTIYLGVFFFVFYALIDFLRTTPFLRFSWINIAIFAFFTSLVAATGVKVHNRAKEISMEEKKPKVLGFLIDVFALPFITVGRWGLSALSRLNILVVIFNLIIELPFQIFVQFVENFRGFIKSKKEEIN